jgi:hypothetical protein
MGISLRILGERAKKTTHQLNAPMHRYSAWLHMPHSHNLIQIVEGFQYLSPPKTGLFETREL